jgi:hypothetical protein
MRFASGPGLFTGCERLQGDVLYDPELPHVLSTVRKFRRAVGQHGWQELRHVECLCSKGDQCEQVRTHIHQL